MDQHRGHNPDLLILALPEGSSLSRWERYGALEREIIFLSGIGRVVPRIIFASTAGTDERRIAHDLSVTTGLAIEAISEAEPDPSLGSDRSLEERTLASAGQARRIIIQTMQYDDGGLAARMLHPLRRTGASVALVARGSFVESRVRAAIMGAHHYATLAVSEIERRLFAQSQLVVGTSEAMIDELGWKYGINPERTRVISQHVAVSEHATTRRDDLVVTTGRFTGGCTAIRTVLQAVAALNDARREGVTVRVIGDGEHPGELPAFARSIGVNAEFCCGLTHDQVIASLGEAAVYMQAEGSRRQSHAVLEAMAVGCPVVVTDLPEYNGIIENGNSGIRVAREPRAFSFALDCLLGDRGFRDMLGEAAHASIAIRCGVDRVVNETLDGYRQALYIAPKQGEQPARNAS